MTSLNDKTLSKIARTHHTPCYVFDIRELARRVEELRSRLPAGAELCYAVKANTFVLSELTRLVERLEVCSPGELRMCRELNIDPQKIVVSGVHKDPELIKELVRSPRLPARVTVESFQQLQLLEQAGRDADRMVPILLRLTGGNQFGIDRAGLIEIAATRNAYPHLDIRGIQFFTGTQKTRLNKFEREIARVDALLDELERAHGFRASELEFGLGLPVAYFEHDAFDEDALLQGICTACADMRFKGNLVLEIGRSLVASCGTYLTSVVDTKRGSAGNYAIVDGGMHQIAYYGNGLAMQAPPCHRVACAPLPLPRCRHPELEETWCLCGSLCTVNDILVRQFPARNLRCGDVIAFQRAGAYCVTEGIALFLSRDLPAVIVIGPDGTPCMVREHLETYGLNMPYTPT